MWSDIIICNTLNRYFCDMVMRKFQKRGFSGCPMPRGHPNPFSRVGLSCSIFKNTSATCAYPLVSNARKLKRDKRAHACAQGTFSYTPCSRRGLTKNIYVSIYFLRKAPSRTPYFLCFPNPFSLSFSLPSNTLLFESPSYEFASPFPSLYAALIHYHPYLLFSSFSRPLI